MKIDEIKLWYEYTYWATARIVATCEKVTPEQYTARTDFGTLRTTLVHMVDAEWAWRRTFVESFVPPGGVKGEAKEWDSKELSEEDFPTLERIKARGQEEERAMRSYLNSLTDQDLNGLVRYKISSGTVRERVLWHCLLHVVNHGTQHRSEAAAILTSYGQSPGDLDVTVFLNAHFNLPS